MKIDIKLLIDDVEVSDSVDPATLSEVDQLDLIEALERCRSQLDALQLRHLHALAVANDAGADASASGLAGSLDRDQRRLVLITEVATALRWSPHVTGERFAIADALATTFPDSLDRFEAGELVYGQVRSLVELTRPLDPELARQVEARVLPRAPQQNLADFRRSLRRAVASVDP